MPRSKHPTTRKITILRAMEGDLYEVRDRTGHVRFMTLFKCIECDSWAPPEQYDGAGRLCRHCAIAEYSRARRLAATAASRCRLVKNLAIAARKRVALLSLAAPSWRDREKIRALYEEARRLTAETGVSHHVDHYYPLQGQLCCGLHVHENLRVLPATENCSKGNGQPLDHSPATVAFIKEYGESGLRTWVKWAKGEKVHF